MRRLLVVFAQGLCAVVDKRKSRGPAAAAGVDEEKQKAGDKEAPAAAAEASAITDATLANVTALSAALVSRVAGRIQTRSKHKRVV